jgi:hypothetical protein
MRYFETVGLRQRSLFFLGGLCLVLTGLLIGGHGCVGIDQWSPERARKIKVAQQMAWAEEELRDGHFVSAETIFAHVSTEPASTALQQRALFFSGLTALLKRKDAQKFKDGRNRFEMASKVGPESEVGRISGYLARVFSEVVAIVETRESERAIVEQQIQSERSRRRDMKRVVDKQKRQLGEVAKENEALKKSLILRNKEIKSLELKIKKLEEIHRTIKEKRESLSEG